jgi:hypothetical protein
MYRRGLLGILTNARAINKREGGATLKTALIKGLYHQTLSKASESGGFITGGDPDRDKRAVPSLITS